LIREQTGETVLLVRYLGNVAPVRVVFLPDRPVPEMAGLPANNPIDKLVLAQLKELRLSPAPLAPDHVFLRRAYLEALGVLPTVDETTAFLADTDPQKRDKLIDKLLARPEFAEFWAQKWSDLLRNEEKALDRKGVAVFLPLDRGPARGRPPAERVRPGRTRRPRQHYANPAGELLAGRARSAPAGRVGGAGVPRGAGGVRPLCHNHPFDRWTSDEYYGFAALFGRIDYRVLENEKRDRLDKHEFVGEQIVFQKRDGEVTNPRTKSPARPTFLGSPTPEMGAGRGPAHGARRLGASPENPFLRPGAGEPHLAAPDGRGAGRSERRLPGDQPADQPGAARLAGEWDFAAGGSGSSGRCGRS